MVSVLLVSAFAGWLVSVVGGTAVSSVMRVPALALPVPLSELPHPPNAAEIRAKASIVIGFFMGIWVLEDCT